MRGNGQEGVRVAIVDDDSGMRESLAILLSMSGFPNRQYESVESFLADPSSLDDLGCLLLDQNFAGMSGIDLLRHLAARGQLFPTILFSARLTSQSIRDAQAIGVRAVLDKPVGPITLITCLRAVLDRP